VPLSTVLLTHGLSILFFALVRNAPDDIRAKNWLGKLLLFYRLVARGTKIGRRAARGFPCTAFLITGGAGFHRPETWYMHGALRAPGGLARRPSMQ